MKKGLKKLAITSINIGMPDAVLYTDFLGHPAG
jgi:hypothetical protein